MAAGSVVPAAGGGGFAGGSVEAACEIDAAASSIHVTVAAATPPAPAASRGAPAAGLVEVPVTTSTPSVGNTGSVGCSLASVGPSGSFDSSSTFTSNKASASQSCIGAAGPLVTPADAAAVAGVGLAAWRVCWRGFHGPGVEAAFQAYRGGALRRWEWACRLYTWVTGVALMVKKMQVLQVALASWTGGLVCLVQVAVTSHVLLMGLAPGWWASHRDTILNSSHCAITALWLWEAATWPANAFQAVYGTTARWLLVPVGIASVHKRPRMCVLGTTVVCCLAYTTLLLQAHAGGASAGLDGALYRGIQGGSWLVVVAGWVYCASNLLLALVCSVVVEVRMRRAWIRATDTATQLHGH